MKTYTRLTLTFLLLILVVPQVGGQRPENGPYVEYHSNGAKKRQTDYKDGKKTFVTEWHRNGQKEKEERYNDDGEQDGVWTRWDENGNKKWERHYKNGKEISRKEF